MPRDALVQQLVASVRASLVVLAAPSGYGKTTAVQLWSRDDDRPFAWVHLGAGDDGPARLLHHVALALHELRPLDPRVAELVERADGSLDAELVPSLGRVLDQLDPHVLVLDGLDAVAPPVARRCLAVLLEWVPDGSQVVVATRAAQVPGAARLRVQGRLLELRAEDLAMSTDAARALFATEGLVAGPRAAAELVRRTEGWPAGLRLAAHALARAAPHEQVLVTGAHRFVAEYLKEEVLAHVSERQLAFLEESSVLDLMHADVLDALLGIDDAGAQLGALEQAGGVLLIPVGADGGWYRYHRLLGEMLRDRLRRRDARRARQLQQRAEALARASGPGPPAPAVVDRGPVLDLRSGAAEVVLLPSALVQPLTAAELRVLALLPTHLSLQEIADRLIISRNTAKTHAVAIYRKLGVSSRGGAVDAARRCGLLRLPALPQLETSPVLGDDPGRSRP